MPLEVTSYKAYIKDSSKFDLPLPFDLYASFDSFTPSIKTIPRESRSNSASFKYKKFFILSLVHLIYTFTLLYLIVCVLYHIVYVKSTLLNRRGQHLYSFKLS